MLKWYLLFTALNLKDLMIVICVIYGILHLLGAMVHILNEDWDAVKKVFSWWRILIGVVLAIIAITWPTKEILLQSYVMNELFIYIKNNPASSLSPQNVLDVGASILEVAGTGVQKLLELMKK